MRLADKTPTRWDDSPFVARITTIADRPLTIRKSEALLLNDSPTALPAGFKAYLAKQTASAPNSRRVISVPRSLDYVSDGDIIAVDPKNGDIRVIYRKKAKPNALLTTQACNNCCVMCSQPPQKEHDKRLLNQVLAAIPLMDMSTPELILTGGEPTLLGDGFVEIVRACRSYLPRTAVHVLTNGRMFRYMSFAKAVADLRHPDMVFGVPLYSEVSHHHDFIVQCRGAFDETVKGVLNLARFEQRVEVRIVISRFNADRLSAIARFIARNLPFVCNVALMGIELVGFAKSNVEALWVDPKDYAPALVDAVGELKAHGVSCSIYNHQLCTLPASLWPYSRQSISDWKNVFFDCCDDCAARSHCCGFFASATVRHSQAVQKLTLDQFIAGWRS